MSDKAQVSESISYSLFPLERKPGSTGRERINMPLGVKTAGCFMGYTRAAFQIPALTPNDSTTRNTIVQNEPAKTSDRY